MFIDASAIVAILNREAGYEDLVRRMGDHEGQLFTSPMARFETSVILARSRSGTQTKPTRALMDACAGLVAAFVQELTARDIHITGSIGDGAIQAAREYGKIVGHPADLNFGDCFAYTCARAYRLKLIYKGNDFAQTDLA
ncbi:ribonuclease VapC28 [Roseovarius sp. A-2]|uniref:type II toxin-antitoxin system VapC family toxin n=1 Tax=Roseovarius sp. A-2 TaxID=1570360 RepID=UPI0009B56246|nr:type II toxin-antitoxin system VapC family toxin [Roseovarius sp. A-2]GAW37177.1 ribonuclease VapC28 [Roseovarius sp. A-2]